MAIRITAGHEGKILLCDFDDTIAKFEGLPPLLPGTPCPGVLEFLPKLHNEGWEIHIFSGRSRYPEGTTQIAAWLDEHNLPYDAIITTKPQYNIIIDDCSISVDDRGWAPIYEKINSGQIGIKASAPGSKDFDYSSVHVVLPKDMGDQLIAWGKKNIPEDTLDKEEGSSGYEDYPHITCKYGLHSDTPEEVLELLKDEKPVKFKLGKISLFKGKDKSPDVVKVEVTSPDLHRLNKKIADGVEVTDTFPNYVPHATIAYVKQGTADHLEGNKDLEGLEAEVDWMEFSSKKKEEGATPIKLKAAFTPSLSNPADNKWGPEDVVIPTKPEWVDCEDTWHFPYVKRNVDWDLVLSQVLDIDKEASSPFRDKAILDKGNLPHPSEKSEDLARWFSTYTFYSPKWVDNLKSRQQAYAIAMRLYESWKSQPASKTKPTQLDLPGLDRDAGPKELALGLGLALAPTLPSHAPAPTQQSVPTKPTLPVGWEHYEHLVSQAADKYKVPQDMFFRLLKTENDIGNPKAVNPSSGALGLAQFMPATAAEMGVNPKDPHSSIYGAAKYLRALYREFGSWEDAVRAYNWGPGNVAKSTDPEKDPKETKEYVEKVKPSKEAMQPNTTWDSNEPFSPLPTNWELHTDDGLLNQQYARQYKGLRTGPYWSNLALLFDFLTEQETEDNLMYKVVDQGPEHVLLQPVYKKADNSSLQERGKTLVKQLMKSLGDIQSIAYKAENLLSRLEDLLQDAETEQQAFSAIQSTIGYLEELGPSTGSVIKRLQSLIQPEITQEGNLISHREITAIPNDYSGKFVITMGPNTLFVPTDVWEDILQNEFDVYGVGHKALPSTFGLPKQYGGTTKGYTVDFDSTQLTPDAIYNILDDYQVQLVKGEKVPISELFDSPKKVGPENTQEVPTMDSREILRRVDKLLDERSKASPERQKQIDQQLRQLKTSLHRKVLKIASTYTDKEMDEITTKNKAESGDWFKDDQGGGNTPHDWNSSTNDFPQPKDMQKGTPLDQLVPVDRRFMQQITPPTFSPVDFAKAPADSGDIDPYDYKKWKKANLISHRELTAANLIDLIWVKVQEISDDFSEVKGQANLLGKLVPWTAKALPTSGELRMYKIDTTEIEKAISKANITAAHQREQLEKVTEKIREQLYAPTASITYRDVPNQEQIDSMWESVPRIWWTKERARFWDKKEAPTTTLKMDYVKDLLRRNKFDSNYFTTFPNGRSDKFSWSVVGQSLLLTKY